MIEDRIINGIMQAESDNAIIRAIWLHPYMIREFHREVLLHVNMPVSMDGMQYRGIPIKEGYNIHKVVIETQYKIYEN